MNSDRIYNCLTVILFLFISIPLLTGLFFNELYLFIFSLVFALFGYSFTLFTIISFQEYDSIPIVFNEEREEEEYE